MFTNLAIQRGLTFAMFDKQRVHPYVFKLKPPLVIRAKQGKAMSGQMLSWPPVGNSDTWLMQCLGLATHIEEPGHSSSDMHETGNTPGQNHLQCEAPQL